MYTTRKRFYVLSVGLSELSLTTPLYTGNGFFYQLKPQADSSTVDIFTLEAIVILSAIHHIVNFARPPHRVLLWTDSMDSVAILDSLAASQLIHNSVLRAIAELILQSGIGVARIYMRLKPRREKIVGKFKPIVRNTGPTPYLFQVLITLIVITHKFPVFFFLLLLLLLLVRHSCNIIPCQP
jgi:hypothetical protein